MLAIVTILWKQLKWRRICQVRWPRGLGLVLEEFGIWRVSVCQLGLKFSPRLSDTWLQRKERREISAKLFVMQNPPSTSDLGNKVFPKSVSLFRTLLPVGARGNRPFCGLNSLSLYIYIFFHLGLTCALEKHKCHFWHLPSRQWCVCCAKSWIFRMEIKIAMSWKLRR